MAASSFDQCKRVSLMEHERDSMLSRKRECIPLPECVGLFVEDAE